MNTKKYEGFFAPLENTMPFFKVAFQGIAGSGKTYTAAIIAIGIYRRIDSKKPIVIFDTESSSKFLRPMFKRAGIPVLVKESHTLPDLRATIAFCNDGGSDILLIDSITHVYEDFLKDYKRKKKQRADGTPGGEYIRFDDWGIIKPIWKEQFAYPLVKARAHILFTGRQGYTYDDIKDEDGNTNLTKTGVKMKAESDTAHEPDVLVYMDRYEKALPGEKKTAWREATVMKDRSAILDGKVFTNPTFDDFSPVLEFLLDDVSEPGEPTKSYPNDDIIGDVERDNTDRKERKILLERNESLVDEIASGRSGDAKAMRLSLLKHAYYGETSETAIASMSAEQLEEANRRLIEIVPLIKRIGNGESHVYPTEKTVRLARTEQLGEEYVADIIAAGTEKLAAYLAHLMEKYHANRRAAV